MAKASDTPVAETVVTETPAVEAPKVDGRVKTFNVPATPSHPYTKESFDEALKGETVAQKRADFIREYWATKHYDRATITTFVRAAAGDESIKYQIIFQATKGHEGGPEPKPKAELVAAAGEAAPAAE
jgi:hypothetical protein